MAVEDARRFIKQVATDHDLRDRINTVSTQEALNTVLKESGYEFSHAEMDQAHQLLLTNSQSAEEATLVNEIKMWWDFINADIHR